MATLDPNSRSFGVDSHATGSAQYGGDDALTAFTPSQPSIKQAGSTVFCTVGVAGD